MIAADPPSDCSSHICAGSEKSPSVFRRCPYSHAPTMATSSRPAYVRCSGDCQGSLAMNVRSPSTTSHSEVAVAGAVVLALMATMTVGCHSGAKTPPGGDALPDWPSDPNWQRYVLGPSSDDVSPVAVKRVHGNVSNPEALVKSDGT